jgi:hypothetical protein
MPCNAILTSLWRSGWRHTRQVKELNAYAATKPGLTFAIMVNQRNNPLNRKIKAHQGVSTLDRRRFPR